MQKALRFQFSIGDAITPRGRWILEQTEGFNSLLEMPGERAGDQPPSCSDGFQFSIGDAGSCGVLDVWVFKFFVCVLARWRLAGLCGLLCLVYR